MGVSWNKPPSQASAHILATFSLFILPAAPVWPHWSSRQEQDSKSPWPLLALFQYEIPGGSVGKWIVHRTSDLENWYRWSCLQSRNRDTENRRLTTERGKLGWMNREIGIYIYIYMHWYICTIDTGGSFRKESACRRHGFNPWVTKIPWRRKQQPLQYSCLGKSHGQRSLAG